MKMAVQIPIPKAPGLQIIGSRPMTPNEIANAVSMEAGTIGLDASVCVYVGGPNRAEVQCTFRNIAGRGGGFMYMFPINVDWFEADAVKLRRLVCGELAKVCLVHGLAPVEIGVAGEERVRGRGRSFAERLDELTTDPPTAPRIPAAPNATPAVPKSYYYGKK